MIGKIKEGTSRIATMRRAIEKLVDVETLLAYSGAADLGVPHKLIAARYMCVAAFKLLQEVSNDVH